MKSFIPWIGGKGALLHEIIPRIPKDIDTYIEVFGGGGSVLLGKSMGKNEVYNDYQRDLVNLFQVIRERPLAFLETLKFLPLNAREEYKYVLDIIEGKQTQYAYLEDELETASEHFEPPLLTEIMELLTKKANQFDVNRAVIYYKAIVYSYGSRGKSYGSRILTLHKLDATIKRASRRLRRVVIENQDFEKLILSKDNETSFFYCDPPYANTSGYKTGDFDHEHFFDWCRKMVKKGNVIFLSEYNAPDDFECVWEGEVKTNFASTCKKATHNATEKLYRLKYFLN